MGGRLAVLVAALACVACGRSTEPAAPDADVDAALDDGAGDSPTDARAPCPGDAAPTNACTTAGDCCGDYVCQGIHCCLLHDAACLVTTECCAPGLCLNRTDASLGTCTEPPR
jgi:hypothetical protein